MGRAGIITPSVNTVLERELPRLLDPGLASFHFARVRNSEDSLEQLSEMAGNAIEAVNHLSDIPGLDTIAFACTSGSFVGGVRYDREVQDRLSEEAGLDVFTTSSAVNAALRRVDARHVAVFTPYEEWLSRKCSDFLRDSGFNPVPAASGFDMFSTDTTDDYHRINTWVKDHLPNSADTIFISCTNFTWFSGIRALEEATDRPVVTSNSATAYELLRRVADPTDADELRGTRLFDL